MQHDKNDEDTKSSSTVNDGCLVLAIGAAVGAAALLTVTVIVATALRICHRQPSFANKRVSQANEVIPFSWYFILCISQNGMEHMCITEWYGLSDKTMVGSYQPEHFY